ncbi:MAG TPA: cytochrome c oxidase subunit 3 [Gemmatimonadales bacterium]|jgi:cytochrome c oxidase subunit I+III
MTAPTRALDVSGLPTTVFDHRSHMWWGTLGFMLIEGTTLLVCLVSYYYLRLNFTNWPPEHTLLPSLLWPTVHVAVLLASIIPVALADRAARRQDLPGLRRWFVVASVFAVSFLFLRWQDFLALNVRWDENAYGSIAWMNAGFHGTILLLQVIETLCFTGFLFTRNVEEKHFSDATDSAFYWYFFVGSWLPIYFTLYLSPRLL